VEHPSAARLISLAIVVGAAAACATSESGTRRNYVLPALEIVAMDAGLNFAGRQLYEPADYEVSPRTIARNLRGPWVVEDDPFEVNQFLHPYQGAMYHNIARSSGLNYWQSAAYTFAGSAMWEIAGESTRPSKNDQIASGIAGSFLGEPLFRTARLLLDRNNGKPGIWRTLAAAVVSPPSGVNRAFFGDRYDPARRQVLPAADVRLQLGVAANDPFLGFSVDYGFPGKSDYSHAHPFDYFNLDAVASIGPDAIASKNFVEHLSTRGLIAGKDYKTGRGSLGVWGLYGGYDYFAPAPFRVSSTSASLGTTLQSAVGQSVTLQTTALAGAAYTAVQSIGSTNDRDYHYGVTPQTLVAARLIAGRRAALDAAARGFFVSDVGGLGTGQRDLIVRADASFALRLASYHGVAVKYVYSHRAATLPGAPKRTQTEGSVGLYYTFLGTKGFGDVR
jgi:hypothetical protein